MNTEREAAARLDSAIDTLLEQPGHRVAVADDELLATARLLRGVLPVFHPHFGFEERLAGLLATAGRPATAVTGRLVSLHPARSVSDGAPAATRPHRVLLAGGAIASGVSLVIPIAGAALLAWRRVRASGGTP